MSDGFTVDVLGEPRPQGSGKLVVSRSTGRPFKKGDDKFARWRNQVTDALVEAKPEDWVPIDGPARLVVSFRFLRPKSQTKAQRAVSWKANGSDLDKLLRAIGDALTAAQVVTDDRVIAVVQASKRYVEPERDAGPGVWIMVGPA